MAFNTISLVPTIKEEDLKSDITGYLHNVSPIKQNNSNVKWFDCEIQMEQGNIRGVCFDPSAKTMEDYKKVAGNKSPIKLANFEMGNKRKGHPIDIIIRKKTILQELTEDLPFERADIISKSATIGSLKDLKPGQLLTLTAMVSNLSSTKEIVKRTTGEKVAIREGQITDPTGTVKLALWESFTDQVVDGDTYKFVNLRLKSDNSKLSLSTTQAGCTIVKCQPFPDLKAPKELPSTTKSEQLEVLGVASVASYHMCPNCNKKIILNGDKNTVKCQNCSVAMNKKRCKQQFYAKIIMKKDNFKMNFMLFHQSLLEVVEIYNRKNNAVDPSALTVDLIEDVILSFDTLKVTYDFTSYTVKAVNA